MRCIGICFIVCLFLRLQDAVFLGDLDLDIAKTAEGEDEVVAVGIMEIVAGETTELAIGHFDLVVEGEMVGGEGDVIGRTGSLDDSLKLDEFPLADACQGDMAMGTLLLGPVGQEDIDIRPLTDEVVGLFLTEAGDKDHAGNDELTHHALRAVGIAMELFLAGYEAAALLMAEGLLDVLAAEAGVLLMTEHGSEPGLVDIGVEGEVEVLRVGYGRATRFVQRICHNRSHICLILNLFCHCSCTAAWSSAKL